MGKFHNVIIYQSLEGEFELRWCGFSDSELNRLITQELSLRDDSSYSLKILDLLRNREVTTNENDEEEGDD